MDEPQPSLSVYGEDCCGRWPFRVEGGAKKLIFSYFHKLSRNLILNAGDLDITAFQSYFMLIRIIFVVIFVMKFYLWIWLLLQDSNCFFE